MNNIFCSLEQGEKRIVLQGSAGVGKTFLVNYLIKEFRKIEPKGIIQITAPTNKAVAVLLEKSNPEYWMDFKTIHKALQLKRRIDDKTGEISFVQNIDEKNPPFKNVKLLIIDEASMLSSEIFECLNLYENLPIIFVGEQYCPH